MGVLTKRAEYSRGPRRSAAGAPWRGVPAGDRGGGGAGGRGRGGQGARPIGSARCPFAHTWPDSHGRSLGPGCAAPHAVLGTAIPGPPAQGAVGRPAGRASVGCGPGLTLRWACLWPGAADCLGPVPRPPHLARFTWEERWARCSGPGGPCRVLTSHLPRTRETLARRRRSSGRPDTEPNFPWMKVWPIAPVLGARAAPGRGRRHAGGAGGGTSPRSGRACSWRSRSWCRRCRRSRCT